MIKTEEGLRQARQLLAEMQRAIAAIPEEHPDATPEWLDVLSEGVVIVELATANRPAAAWRRVEAGRAFVARGSRRGVVA